MTHAPRFSDLGPDREYPFEQGDDVEEAREYFPGDPIDTNLDETLEASF